MDFNTLYGLVAQEFITNWTTTPVCYPEQDFTPPNGPWIRLGVYPGASVISSMGVGGRNTQTGLVIVDHFTKKFSGIRSIHIALDDIKAILNRKNLSGVQFSAPDTAILGQVTDSKWHHSQVIFPWEYFETP